MNRGDVEMFNREYEAKRMGYSDSDASYYAINGEHRDEKPKTSFENFKNDLSVGIKMEDEILKVIQKKYPKAYRFEGKNSGFDLVIPEIDKTIEVKQDFKAKHTNNIVVEVSYGDKLSALSLTKADFWIITDGYVLYWIKPIEMYRCIEQNRLSPFDFVGKGDSKSKEAYLIKRNMFEKYCEKIIKIKTDSPIYRDNFISNTKDLHEYE